MKYSILILIFVMSILAQAYEPTSDLDKPFSGKAKSAFQLGNSVNGNYMDGWTISQIINKLLVMNEVNSYGTAGYNLNTAYTTAGAVDILKADLQNYVQKFPASSQLFSASVANGTTVTYNTYAGNVVKDLKNDGVTKKSTYDSKTGKTYSISTISSSEESTGGAYQLTFYAGRNTSAGDNNKGGDYLSKANTRDMELTISTATRRYKIYAYDTTTPIVLDLDGDGKLEASKGNYLPHGLCVPESELVAFDMNADGFEELVEWVGANDGLLVHDIVNNEVSAKNLFGDATGFKDGFEQLATLDTNKDDALTGEELAGLAVWQDKNRNAKIDNGEIHSLESLGITKLNVKAIELTATFERNGKYYMMWDWNPVTIMVKKAK